ncbi:SLC13 family permease [Desulfosarcina sp. OttesenSCG-928-A07]|nr:SLC13 family permease [Desulfosarcina sp. OttesenSCG-928-G17]MDL2330061.1 SLC13 family permease [Desulfosarcina sp. OttesenSCG-928-A07]
MAADMWPTILTIGVIIGTVIFFVMGRFRTDLIALCALMCLMVGGVLTPAEALTGFSNNIILIIAGMFVVGGAIVNSGLASVISGRILKLAGSNRMLLFMLIMFISGMVGAMVSNTGTVAIMMPIVVSMAYSVDMSPSRFLMPLGFMSSMGGMFTLIGNAPNMVANEVYVRAGYPSLELFSFFPIGVVCFAFGMVILVPATYWYLSRRKGDAKKPEANAPTMRELADKYQLARHMCKMEVPETSPIVGQTLMRLGLTNRFGVAIQEIRRKKKSHFPLPGTYTEQISPGPQTAIQAGDILYGVGAVADMERLGSEFGLHLSVCNDDLDDSYLFDAIGICELVIMSSSRLIGLTVAESGLREQFGVTLLGIQRGSRYILENITAQTVHAGDAFLVQGSWKDIARLDEASQHWVVVGRPQDDTQSDKQGTRIFVAVTLIAMIAVMALNILPTVTAVMLAALIMILGRCFRNMEDVYTCINWETLIMIACMLPLAIAMEKIGLINVIATHMTAVGVHYGPYIALALVYAVTSALNIIISFTPLTLLIAPVALKIAVALNLNPLPFILAVATAASMCFASSFSTPSNALVVSVGRYTFMDFLIIGLPLQILLGIIMVFFLPICFPF